MIAPSGDRVRVTVHVAVSPADAFAVFTEEIDRWWRRGPAYRIAGTHPGVLHLEAGVGGRLFEQHAAGAALLEVGRVTAWDPPRHLAFDWRAVAFEGGETTQVEVWFEPSGDGTSVTLVHRGWAAIDADHPVRHGQDVAAFLRGLGMWWGSLMTSLREHAAAHPRGPRAG